MSKPLNEPAGALSADERRASEDAVDSTGPNARPRHDTIAQTGAGLPDDAGEPVEIDEAEAARIDAAIRGPSGPDAA